MSSTKSTMAIHPPKSLSATRQVNSAAAIKIVTEITQLLAHIQEQKTRRQEIEDRCRVILATLEAQSELIQKFLEQKHREHMQGLEALCLSLTTLVQNATPETEPLIRQVIEAIRAITTENTLESLDRFLRQPDFPAVGKIRF